MPTLFQNPSSKPSSQPAQPVPGHVSQSSAFSKVPLNLGHDHMGLFTSYAENPTGLRFETQQETEQVVIFMRQHFAVNIPWILATALLLVAPFTIVPFFFMIIPIPIVLSVSYKIIGLLFWFVGTMGYGLLNFLHWYYNIYIVTTERVIDIDFIQLLYKKFSEARLDRIEDVTFTSSGFFAAIFNYGDVTIQTAAEAREFSFDSIPKPASVVRVIGALIDKERPIGEPQS
jgi:hypothetical protein